MLQMSCPNCDGVINSQFLADISTIECGRCKETIPVKDVFITTQYFTIHREDFLNRTYRFQRLLKEVEKDRLLMANDKGASIKSIESLEQFRASLQELLAGARDSYRLEIPRELYLVVSDQNRKIKGKLLNLSTEGGSIEFVQIGAVPRKKAELDIDFFFPGLSGRLHTHAKVIWANDQIKDDGSQSATIGVTFIEMDENTRNCIWDFIIDNTPVPYQRETG